MKKILAFLKRAFSGPVNSMKDVKERQKDLKKLLIISGIATAVCVILGIIPPLKFMSFITPVPGLFMLVVLFFFFILKRIKARFEFLNCDECKTDINIVTRKEFDTYVSYEHISTSVEMPKPVIVEGKNAFEYKSITVRGTVVVKLNLFLTCPNCGAVKTKEITLRPFKCEIERKNLIIKNAVEMESLLTMMKDSVKEAIDDCLDEDVDYGVPVTVQSIWHPNYENRAQPGCAGAREPYKNVIVTYFRYVDELIDGYFRRNELNF
ncbi:MAG: hypothetical protein IJD42_05820 [Clostridia bacterium]|nr:hypothetical protein [Clostridia bacterium]